VCRNTRFWATFGASGAGVLVARPRPPATALDTRRSQQQHNNKNKEQTQRQQKKRTQERDTSLLTEISNSPSLQSARIQESNQEHQSHIIHQQHDGLNILRFLEGKR